MATVDQLVHLNWMFRSKCAKYGYVYFMNIGLNVLKQHGFWPNRFVFVIISIVVQHF
jgi:hypothetical protein